MIGLVRVQLGSHELEGQAQAFTDVLNGHLPDLAQAVLGQGVDGPDPVPVRGRLVVWFWDPKRDPKKLGLPGGNWSAREGTQASCAIP